MVAKPDLIAVAVPVVDSWEIFSSLEATGFWPLELVLRPLEPQQLIPVDRLAVQSKPHPIADAAAVADAVWHRDHYFQKSEVDVQPEDVPVVHLCSASLPQAHADLAYQPVTQVVHVDAEPLEAEDVAWVQARFSLDLEEPAVVVVALLQQQSPADARHLHLSQYLRHADAQRLLQW